MSACAALRDLPRPRASDAALYARDGRWRDGSAMRRAAALTIGHERCEAWAPSEADESAVRPAYVKSNKNDARDAEAICEAVGRPSMRFVEVKSQAQQDVMALHRVRSLLIRERTALMNQMRGLLAESGIVMAQGAAALRRALALILEARRQRDK